MRLIDIGTIGSGFSLPTKNGGPNIFFSLSEIPDGLDGVRAALVDGLADYIVLPSAHTAEAVAKRIRRPSIKVVAPWFSFPLYQTPIASRPEGVLLRLPDRGDNGSPFDALAGEAYSRVGGALRFEGEGWASRYGLPGYAGVLDAYKVCVVPGSPDLRHGVLDWKIVEAMSAGCAVVARFVPGLRGVFPDGSLCAAFYRHDTEAVSHACDLLRDGVLASRIAQAGAALAASMTREDWLERVKKACS